MDDPAGDQQNFEEGDSVNTAAALAPATASLANRRAAYAADAQGAGQSAAQGVREATMRLFINHLLANDQAMEYLRQRGASDGLLRSGRLGLCPPDYAAPFRPLKGRIIVPIRDAYGDIVAFAGRIFEPMREQTMREIQRAYQRDPAEAERRVQQWESAKWINEPFDKERHLFLLDRAKRHVRERGYCVVVEGYMDALILAANGLGNTSAVCGASLTERHANLIRRYCKRAVFLFDGDAAGEKAVAKASERATAAGLEWTAIMLPSGYDPDDFVIEFGGKDTRTNIEAAIASGARIVNWSI